MWLPQAKIDCPKGLVLASEICSRVLQTSKMDTCTLVVYKAAIASSRWE